MSGVKCVHCGSEDLIYLLSEWNTSQVCSGCYSNYKATLYQCKECKLISTIQN